MISRILLLSLLLTPALIQAAALVQVRITGVEGALLKNIEAGLGIFQQKDSERLNQTLVRKLHARAPQEIRRALQPFGFYRPQIDDRLEQTATQPAAWTVEYQVTPGQPIPLGRVSVKLSGEGEKHPQLLDLLRQETLISGEPLDHPLYETRKKALQEAAQQLGFLKARFSTHRIGIDLQGYQADIDLTLDTGPLYRFGPVEFVQGEQEFSADLLDKYVTIERGAPFTSDGLSTLRNGLNSSGYFQQVAIERQPADHKTHEIPLKVVLTPRLPNRYRAKLGFGTDTGFGLRLNWNRRFLNRWGHQFDTGLVYVQDRNKFVYDFRYQIPEDPLRQDFWIGTLRLLSKELSYEDAGFGDGGVTRLNEISLGVARQQPRNLFDLWRLEETISLEGMYQTYNSFDLIYGHLDTAIQDFTRTVIHGTEIDTLNPEYYGLVPSVTWVYRGSDTRTRLRLSGAYQGLAANFSFAQLHAETHHVFPLTRSTFLSLRGEAGFTQADTVDVTVWKFRKDSPYPDFDEIAYNQIPDSLEFKTGGDRSVRGYEYESLKPQDSITGGKHLLVGSIELEQKVWGKWGVAAFYDIGNAFNDYQDFDLKQGTGVGARWQSPIGLVRLDLAFGLDNEQDDWRIHLTVGPRF